MRRVRERITYANVMSSIAVFLVLGGAAFAATQLPKNSVGTKQLKANAVNSSKVKDGSLLSSDFKSGQLPAGPQGPKGDKGEKGEKGETGSAGPFPDVAPTGHTLRGTYNVEGYTQSPAQIADATSFIFTLPAAPTAVIVPLSGPNPDLAHCSGSAAEPKAASGFLCLYEEQRTNGTPTAYDVSKFGFKLAITATNGSASYVYTSGTWATTP